MAKKKKSEPKREQPEDKPKYNEEQYKILKRCSDKKDITEWNKWQEEHPDEKVLLGGADLYKAHLENADLERAHLENAYLVRAHLEYAYLEGANLENADLLIAHLENADLEGANLQGADLSGAHLQGADLPGANLENAHLLEAYLEDAHLTGAHLEGARLIRAAIQGADFSRAIVDGKTLIWDCNINRKTNFEGVGLGSIRIHPRQRQLLEYNIRRMNWEEWYTKGCWWQRILKRLFIWTFWLISDYGLSTWRIILTFFGLAVVFAVVYWVWPSCVMVNNVVGDIRGFWHALYFSVVTMTTLGFGDIAANPDSWGGQTLLMLQVILGYVLLGALLTRFAVLFTAGGPAGKFTEKTAKSEG